jgi:D-alanyl-D-alanine dipeptidase
LIFFLGSAMPSPSLADSTELVEVTQLEPTIRVDLRYATIDNFVHRAVYPKSARCYLRRAVALRLAAVQKQLQRQGLGLKVFDCYRPLSAQRALWAVVPDERYVASPDKGSRHNRGAAVDLTLVDGDGHELAMPTAYDAFSERAHRSYQALPATVLANRQRLEAAMVGQGFVPLPTEWWHFDDGDSARYPLSDLSFDSLGRQADDPPLPRRHQDAATNPPPDGTALRR